MNESDEFQGLIDPKDTEKIFGQSRKPYTKKPKPPLEDFGDYELIPLEEAKAYFELIPASQASEVWNSIPARADRPTLLVKPVCFIDGEGANDGEPIIQIRKGTENLERKFQKQNYALLGATLESGEYYYLLGLNNREALSSKQCLDFILNLPAKHVIVGYGLTYDVEKWLIDLSEHFMQILNKNSHVWWKGYKIFNIPGKMFYVSRKIGKKKISRTVYDISGFFQVEFKEAIRKWHVGTPDEWKFIDAMKKKRPDFGPITKEVLEYNNLEGKHGIALFHKVRTEYSKLGLRLPRPVGAGSIASAMFRKNRLDNYMPAFQSIPTEVMLQSFIGGRFDIAKIGLIGDTYQIDINSAYPYIASNLPCLACGNHFKWTEKYEESANSLWLVRWHDNDNRWAPFPYRTDGNHIRYYSSGTGYYYGSEVSSALQLDSDIQILGGYHFVCGCDHRPFQWIEDYYKRRQEMLRNGDFGDKIIKLGLNAIYGKLAQTKGRMPRYQNLIWAAMITSGTRAMLLNAIAQNPQNIISCATDAVITYEPVDVQIDSTILGAWKQSRLADLLLLGNGIYHSTTLDKDGEPIAKNRGFPHTHFPWDRVRNDYLTQGKSVVTKHEYIGFSGAFRDKRLEERGGWLDEDIQLNFEVPKGKEQNGDWIWPGNNPTPYEISRPAKINLDSLRIPGLPENRELS